jgi:hypothetical protein
MEFCQLSQAFDRIAKRVPMVGAAAPEGLTPSFHHPTGMTKDEHEQAIRRAARRAWDTLSADEQADLIRERPQLAALCQHFLQ